MNIKKETNLHKALYSGDLDRTVAKGNYIIFPCITVHPSQICMKKQIKITLEMFATNGKNLIFK